MTLRQNDYALLMEEKAGYIYVVYNEMFDFYGSDVFKVGKTKDIAKRVSSYTTSYIKPVEIKFLSELCIDHHLCEKVIFDRLKKYRITPNREFFRINIDQLVKQIEEVVNGINNNEITEYCSSSSSRNHTIISEEDKDFKQSVIQEFITLLGFQFYIDPANTQQKKLPKEELIENINNLREASIFTNNKRYHKLFGSSNRKLTHLFGPNASLKAKLGYINSVLHQRGFYLLNIRKQEQPGNKTSYYSLRTLDTNDGHMEVS